MDEDRQADAGRDRATELLPIFLSPTVFETITACLVPQTRGAAIEAKVDRADGFRGARGSGGAAGCAGADGVPLLDDKRQAGYVQDGWNVNR